MSMKHSPSTVFCGGLGALALMTILSTGVGSVLPKLMDRKYSHYTSIFLFFAFGTQMLYEGFHMNSNQGQSPIYQMLSSSIFNVILYI